MRPPNQPSQFELTATRARSHSFAGLAPPPYEETADLPSRSASSLAIPIPSYEEATGFESPPNPVEFGTPESSVVVIEDEAEEESDESSHILMNIPERSAPSNQSSSSSSSSASSRSSFNPCKGRLRKIVLGTILISAYALVLFFAFNPILEWLQPENTKNTDTRIFLIVAFITPALALFCVLRYGEDWS